mmetsp:Transcript_23965/g.34311  ORF Transcript_23965/g.34311 Transcript_23965/m.34311 type:complete len:227 (+) Transcript_23965:668-1348(+)
MTKTIQTRVFWIRVVPGGQKEDGCRLWCMIHLCNVNWTMKSTERRLWKRRNPRNRRGGGRKRDKEVVQEGRKSRMAMMTTTRITTIVNARIIKEKTGEKGKKRKTRRTRTRKIMQKIQKTRKKDPLKKRTRKMKMRLEMTRTAKKVWTRKKDEKRRTRRRITTMMSKKKRGIVAIQRNYPQKGAWMNWNHRQRTRRPRIPPPIHRFNAIRRVDTKGNCRNRSLWTV